MGGWAVRPGPLPTPEPPVFPETPAGLWAQALPAPRAACRNGQKTPVGTSRPDLPGRSPQHPLTPYGSQMGNLAESSEHRASKQALGDKHSFRLQLTFTGMSKSRAHLQPPPRTVKCGL